MRNIGSALATQKSENNQPSVSALPMLVQDNHGWIKHLVALCLDWVVAAISQEKRCPLERGEDSSWCAVMWYQGASKVILANTALTSGTRLLLAFGIKSLICN